VVNECFRNAQGPHGVDVEHLRPGLVIDVPDGLASRSTDASIVEEEVNSLPVELSGSRLNTHGLSDIQGQDLQFVIARTRQSAQLRSRLWLTRCRVNLPAIGQILSCELESESAIGTSDQSAWHGFLSAELSSRSSAFLLVAQSFRL
jgi:hypothetical protein